MKKILMTLLVMSVVAGVFADPYQIPAEDIEYKTFNKTQYVTEYVSEFTSVQDFERKHLPTNNWMRKNRQIAVRTVPASQVFIEKNRNYGPNDVFHMGTRFDEAYTIENGVLGINTSAYRIKNNNGYDYHYYSHEINCGEWWKTVGQGRLTKESYFMHIDGKKMFEIKFKVPRSFYGFEVFMISRDSHFDGNRW